MIFVFTGPSGAGKSTLARHALMLPNTTVSVSCTTRAPRGNEVDGVHYHFLTDVEFADRVGNEAFVEWAAVHGHYYGTTVGAIDNASATGKHVILDIDVQGARSIKLTYGNRAKVIFVYPPTMDDLEERLRGRGEDSEDVIRKRLANAVGELEDLRRGCRDGIVDHAICNEDLATSKRQVERIIGGES